MKDAITIRFTATEFKALGGKLDNCRLVKKELIEYPQEFYTHEESNASQKRNVPKIIREMRLPNPKRTHNMIVTIDEWGRIKVNGSVRKWYFGRASISELTREQFLQAIKEIASALNIPYSALMAHRGITHMEIGYNVITKTPISNILPRVIHHGRMKQPPSDYLNKHETVYIPGSDKKLILYDKSQEMLANAKSKKERIMIQNDINKRRRKGQYVLRLECEMFYGQSMKRYGTLSIRSLEDLYQNWYRIHALLAKEFAKTKILGNLVLAESMTHKERELAEAISEYGWEEAVTRVAKDRRVSENQVKREGFRLSEKYSSRRAYSPRSFRIDFARHIFGINRYHEKLPLSEMYHLLWSTKKSREIDISAL